MTYDFDALYLSTFSIHCQKVKLFFNKFAQENQITGKFNPIILTLIKNKV